MTYVTLFLTIVFCVIVNGYSLPDCSEVKEQFHTLSKKIFHAIDRNVSIDTILLKCVQHVLLQEDYNKITITKPMVENSNWMRTFSTMSKACQYYTEIMTFKQQMQHLMLLNDVIPSGYVEKVTLLMIDLQTAANKLQIYSRVRM